MIRATFLGPHKYEPILGPEEDARRAKVTRRAILRGLVLRGVDYVPTIRESLRKIWDGMTGR